MPSHYDETDIDAIVNAIDDDEALGGIERAIKRRKLQEEQYRLSQQKPTTEAGLLDPILAAGSGAGGAIAGFGKLLEEPPDAAEAAVQVNLAALQKLGVVTPEQREVVGREAEKIRKYDPLTGGIKFLDTVAPGIEKYRKKIGGAIRRAGERFAKPFREAREELPTHWASRTFGDVVSTIVQSAPTMAAAGVGGIPAAATVAAAQSYTGMLEQGVDNLKRRFPDMSETEATRQAMPGAVIGGAITGLLTRFVPKGTETRARELTKALAAGKWSKKALGIELKGILRDMGWEMAEEVPDEIAQTIIETLSTNPDMTIPQAIERVGMAGLAGFITPGALGGIDVGLRRIKPSVEPEPEPPPIPEPIPQTPEPPPQAPEPAPVAEPAQPKPAAPVGVRVIPAVSQRAVQTTMDTLSDNSKDKILTYAAQKFSDNDIAKKSKISSTKVRHVLAAMGVPLKSITVDGQKQENPAFLAWAEDYLRSKEPGAPTKGEPTSPTIPSTSEVPSTQPPTSPKPEPEPVLPAKEPEPVPPEPQFTPGSFQAIGNLIDRDQPTVSDYIQSLDALLSGEKPMMSMPLRMALNPTVQQWIINHPAQIVGKTIDGTMYYVRVKDEELLQDRAMEANSLQKVADDKTQPADMRKSAMRTLGKVYGFKDSEINEYIKQTFEEGYATKERKVKEGGQRKYRGADQGVQTKGEDRQRQATEPEPRKTGGDSGVARKIQKGFLTPTQLNRYQGGQLVRHKTIGHGALEVIDDVGSSYIVRKLSDNSTFTVLKSDAYTVGVESTPNKQEGRRIPSRLDDSDVEDTSVPMTEDTSTIAGLTYQRPSGHAENTAAKMVASAIGKLKAVFPGLQINKIRFVDGKRVGAVIWTMPSEIGWDTLYVDLKELASDLGKMSPEQGWDYINAVASEELIHNAGGLVIWQQWVGEGAAEGTGLTFREYYYKTRTEHYNDLSPAQRASVVKAYGMQPTQHARIAEEFERMLVQRQQDGITTEEVLSNRWINHLKAILRRITNWMRKSDKRSGTGELLQANARAIQELLNSQQELETDATKEPGKPGQPATARVLNLREAQQQELEPDLITPQQLQAVQNDTWTQLEAAVGHIRQSWEYLLTEVQGHLGFIKDRLDALDNYRAALKKPETRSQSLQQMIESLPPEDQGTALLDSYLNWHELKTQSLQLESKLGLLQSQAEEILVKPEGKDIESIRRSLVGEMQKKLLAARDAEAANGNDVAVAQLNQAIARLQNAKTGWEGLERAIVKLFDNPNVERITFQEIGMSPEEFDFVKATINAYGDKAAIQKLINDSATLKKYNGLVEAIDQVEQAIEYVREAVFGDTEFSQQDPEYMQRYIGLEEQLKTENEFQMVYRDPFDDNKRWVFDFSMETGMDQDNQARMLQLAGEFRRYLMQPRTDPLRRAAVERHLMALENVYLNPAFHSGAPHLKMSDINPFNVITTHLTGHRLTTPEQRLVGIGSVASNVANLRYVNWTQAADLILTLQAEWGPRIQDSASKAIKSHGNIAQHVWLEDVINPIIWSHQHIGAKHYKAGDMILGRKITKEDMESIRLQKKFTDEVISKLRNLQTTQNKLFPRKIQDTKSIYPIDRYAGDTGPMTMPRRLAAKARDYAKAFLRLKPLDESGRLRNARKLVAGHHSQAYYDLIVSHMRSAAYTPDYRAFVSSPFIQTYIRLTRDIDAGDKNAPSSFDDVIDGVMEDQLDLEPEEQLSEDDIARQILFNELGKGFDKVAMEASEQRAENSPHVEVDITSTENWLTSKRGTQILPDSLYTFTAATKQDRAAMLGSVHEIYAQNTLDTLKQVRTELNEHAERLKNEISRMTRTERVSSRKARKAVRKKTSKQQLKGEMLWDYDEVGFHTKAIQYSIHEIEKAYKSDKLDRFYNDELRGVSRIGRRLIASGPLGHAAILFRNMMGGTLQGIRQMQALGMAWTPNSPIGWVMGMNAAYYTFKTVKDMSLGIVRQVTNSKYTMHYLANTKWGKDAAKALENGDFWAQWLTGPIKFMMHENYMYHRMHDEFGVIHEANWATRLKNIYQFFSSGARLSADPKEVGTIGKAFESILTGAYELGFPSMNPGGATTSAADITANSQGMTLSDRHINNLKLMALKAYRNRSEIGMSLDEQLTPQEITGNKWANERHAVRQRNLFASAGMTLDKVMRRYYDRYLEAKARGEEELNTVPFLDRAEYNSFQMVWTRDINKAGIANRPELFSRTEMGRWMGLFWGYPMYQNSKLLEAMARTSREARDVSSVWRGTWAASKILFATMLVSWPVGEFVRIISYLFYDDEREQRQLAGVKNLPTGFNYLMNLAGPFLPMHIGLINTVSQRTLKPGIGIGRSGINLVPMTIADSFFAAARDAISTRSIIKPGIKLLARWFPNMKAFTNRSPFFDGTTTFYNTVRSIRAAAPSGMELRQVYFGNIFWRSKISDNKDNVINALLRDDGPDWETVRRERDIAIKEMQEDGQAYAPSAFDSAVLQRAPMRHAFGRLLTREERARVLDHMAQDDIERLEGVEKLFADYAKATGRTFNLVAVDKTKVELPPIPKNRKKEQPYRIRRSGSVQPFR